VDRWRAAAVSALPQSRAGAVGGHEPGDARSDPSADDRRCATDDQRPAAHIHGDGVQTMLVNVAYFGSMPAPGVARRIRLAIHGAANAAHHRMLPQKLRSGGDEASSAAERVVS